MGDDLPTVFLQVMFNAEKFPSLVGGKFRIKLFINRHEYPLGIFEVFSVSHSDFFKIINFAWF